ncbi:homeobox protein vent1 [Lepisosteus oculatus]|uniref:homeobox protein vent1 n=1 Tax=Lepisosteus oculatus TaxID=7918 RepID=UPI0037146AD8
MVKSFSVEWLAQSDHNCNPEQEQKTFEQNTVADRELHIPCLAQPRPHTSYTTKCLQPKGKTVKNVLLSGIAEHPDDQRDSDPVSTNLLSNPVSVSISERNGDSSGYESETASSECLSHEEDTEGESARRRIRTKFTSDQIYKLEKTFSKDKYLGATERLKLAAKLNLSEIQVKTWFQNRRMKLKREMQDIRAEFFSPVLMNQMVFPAGLSLQHHNFPGQQFSLNPFATATPAFYSSVLPQVPGTPMGIPQPALHQMQMMVSHYY